MGLPKLTASAVKEAVPSLYGVVNSISGDIVADLPETEAHLGHVDAIVKFDIRNGNHFGGVWLGAWRMSFEGDLDGIDAWRLGGLKVRSDRAGWVGEEEMGQEELREKRGSDSSRRD